MKKSILILFVYTVAISMQTILSRFDWYRDLYRLFPFYIPESIKALLGVLLCRIVARGIFGPADQFALRRRAWSGLSFGFLCSLPMLFGFSFTRTVHIHDPIGLIFLAGLFPLAEEVLSRGFAFRLLYHQQSWPLWPAAAVVALITGAVHIEKGQTAAQILALFALTGLGGALFSWLLARWNSLWFPLALHMCMNLWWEVFTVSGTALGGWFAFSLQIACILLSIIATVRLTPAPVRRDQPCSSNGSPDNRSLLRKILVAT
jgi:membrane protease YdiL (CAAX protease family)